MRKNLTTCNDDLDLLLSSEDFNFNLYSKSISNLNLLSDKEESELGYKILEGDDDAKKTLIEHNLRLVIFFAKNYLKPGIDILDLIQDGNLGLIKAAEKFDITKGFKFSTYASGWITQYIRRGINNSENTIHIPCHIQEKIEKIYHLAIKENLFLEDKIDTHKVCKKLELKESVVKDILASPKNIISLDIATTESGENKLKDLLTDDKTVLPEDELERSEIFSAITKALTILSKKEQEVILCRFGFYEDRPQSLQEISEKLGVTKERVRQIESKALKTLKSNPSIIENLSLYLQ